MTLTHTIIHAAHCPSAEAPQRWRSSPFWHGVSGPVGAMAGLLKDNRSRSHAVDDSYPFPLGLIRREAR